MTFRELDDNANEGYIYEGVKKQLLVSSIRIP